MTFAAVVFASRLINSPNQKNRSLRKFNAMSDQRMTSSSTSDFQDPFDKKNSQPLYKIFKKANFLTLLGCLSFLLPLTTLGQSSSSFAEARLACAEGLGQQAVYRASAQGFQRGLADLCITALNWAANNGKLLEIYINMSETGEGGARLLISQLADRAVLSRGQFRASDSPLGMWNKGELTPSLAFDAAFAQSFLEKSKAPPGAVDPAELKRETEECLNLTLAIALCANAGRIQGAIAYQTSNAFSTGSATSTPTPGSQGPDRAQTGAAVDRKFQIWSQSWSWDRYLPGSARITALDCSEQCKALGQFSFNRLGAVHTIAFVAFLSSEGDGKYSLGRLCYNDDTNGMRECTN